MGKIYLVAVDHRDVRQGPKRFRQLCDELKPDVLLQESAREDFERIRQLAGELEQRVTSTNGKKTAETLVTEFYRLILPFPIYAVLDYARQHGIEHVFADTPKEPEVAFQGAEVIMNDFADIATESPQRFTPELFEQLRETVHGPELRSGYLQRAWQHYLSNERRISNELILLALRARGKLGKRDQHMEGVLRDHYTEDRTLVFTLGMVHATDSFLGTTLYSRIKDLDLERHLL